MWDSRVIQAMNDWGGRRGKQIITFYFPISVKYSEAQNLHIMRQLREELPRDLFDFNPRWQIDGSIQRPQVNCFSQSLDYDAFRRTMKTLLTGTDFSYGRRRLVEYPRGVSVIVNTSYARSLKEGSEVTTQLQRVLPDQAQYAYPEIIDLINSYSTIDDNVEHWLRDSLSIHPLVPNIQYLEEEVIEYFWPRQKVVAIVYDHNTGRTLYVKDADADAFMRFSRHSRSRGKRRLSSSRRRPSTSRTRRGTRRSSRRSSDA